MDPLNSTAAAPEIVVQIVHIEGPRKGEIQEFSQARITFGRDPSCDVVFPRDLRTVSRHHAEINREGNRFHLVNRSPNGCFVNNRPAEEAYLKQGDVLVFSEGGPKVSFLSSVQAAPRARPATPPSPPTPPPRPSAPPPRPAAAAFSHPTPAPSRPSAPAETGAFTIQYGTAIRSFKQAAVRLGRDASSDFVLGDPRVFGTHAEIYVRQGQYHLRDLTESQATLLNGRAILADTPLQENDVVGLCEGGPKLRYLGSGRLAEVIEASPEPPPRPAPAAPESPAAVPPGSSLADRMKSLFRK
ncbi:MAG: FHA domain-containing protein [Deltaproteobacteria bacterium]|nr:FHA domain-containing protein [Deltaproteobacteria bacterium]